MSFSRLNITFCSEQESKKRLHFFMFKDEKSCNFLHTQCIPDNIYIGLNVDVQIIRMNVQNNNDNDKL